MPSFLDHQHLHAFMFSGLRAGVWLLLLAVIFMPLELLFAAHPRKILDRKFVGDVGFYFVSALVPSLLLTPPLALVALEAHHFIPVGFLAAVGNTPIWLRAVLALVVSEIGFYWGHRWSHEIPLLWRFHAVHHNPSELYFLISARAHPVDNVFTRLCGLIPVYILGIATPLTPSGGAVSALLVLVLTMWGFFIHSNIRWKLGPLGWLISTPAFHHWHHTLSGPQDRNFASMLPWMDRIFGTYHMPANEWPTSYGIETTLPSSVAGQLIYPLRPAAFRPRSAENVSETPRTPAASGTAISIAH